MGNVLTISRFFGITIAMFFDDHGNWHRARAGETLLEIELMHPEVDWPNAWEGGRVVGREAVLDYWRRQFEAISSRVEPEGFCEEPDGSVMVDVRQVVHDAQSGELLSDSRVRHRYWLDDGLVVKMEVVEPSSSRVEAIGTEANPRPDRMSVGRDVETGDVVLRLLVVVPTSNAPCPAEPFLVERRARRTLGMTGECPFSAFYEPHTILGWWARACRVSGVGHWDGDDPNDEYRDQCRDQEPSHGTFLS